MVLFEAIKKREAESVQVRSCLLRKIEKIKTLAC